MIKGGGASQRSISSCLHRCVDFVGSVHVYLFCISVFGVVDTFGCKLLFQLYIIFFFGGGGVVSFGSKAGLVNDVG